MRASQGDYDILIMNSGWFAEMYFGGFVTAISDIDPTFKLDPDLFTLGDTIYFDPETKTMSPSGKLMSVPIQPNIPMLFYRGDLYKEKGLKVVETFEDLYNNAKALHDPPKMYGMVQRGARGPNTVSYDFYPYLFGMGGAVFKDQANGDYSITLNNDKGKEALDYYLKLAKDAGHPKTASLGPGGDHPGAGHRPRRPCQHRHRRVVADGRPEQVDRRRQDGVCADAACARPASRSGARSLARRHLAQRAG